MALMTETEKALRAEIETLENKLRFYRPWFYIAAALGALRFTADMIGWVT